MTGALTLLPATLLLLLLLVAYRVQQRRAAALRKSPPTGRFVVVDGCTIHALVTGHGPDLVLLHGGSGNLRDMTFRLAPLLAGHFRLFIFDRPGLGYSTLLTGTNDLGAQASTLCRAASVLGADQPLVLGHSYGVAVALAWARQHPETVSGVIGVGGASSEWAVPASFVTRATATRLGRWLVAPVLSALATDRSVNRLLTTIFAPQSVPSGYRDHVGIDLTLRPSAIHADACHRAHLGIDMKRQEARYCEITCPIELVHGLSDPIVDFNRHAQVLASRLPTAVLTPLDGLGHMAHHIQPKAVLAAVERAARRAETSKTPMADAKPQAE